MNIALRQPMTLAQFLAWEEQAAIQRNLITALTNRLIDRPCQPFGSKLKIKVAEHIR